jgi:hypothetical protein
MPVEQPVISTAFDCVGAIASSSRRGRRSSFYAGRSA